LPKKVPFITEKEVEESDAGVTQAQKDAERAGKGRGKYNGYTAEERAQIGKYVVSVHVRL